MGRRVCCVCKKVLGPVPGIEGDTHTYCPTCFALAMAEVERLADQRRREKPARRSAKQEEKPR